LDFPRLLSTSLKVRLFAYSSYQQFPISEQLEPLLQQLLPIEQELELKQEQKRLPIPGGAADETTSDLPSPSTER